MQPQGHVQLLMDMLIFGMNVQQALDAPRICIGHLSSGKGEGGDKRIVYVEEGIDEQILYKLRERGHNVEVVRGWDRRCLGDGRLFVHFQTRMVIGR